MELGKILKNHFLVAFMYSIVYIVIEVQKGVAVEWVLRKNSQTESLLV